MRMDGQEESSNVEDVRGMGGGGGGFGIGGRGIGLGSIAVAVIAGWIFGINPLALLGMMGGSDGGGQVVQQQGPAPAPPANDAGAKFVSQVLRSTEVVWTDVFRQAGRTYQPPRLVLFSDRWPTACGQGQAAMGPFYCPPDQRVYLDLGFFDEMASRFRAPGQFPQAYVIAHEIGHHIQNLLGVSGKVDEMRGRMSKRDANAMSVRVELQADCLAGVWAYHANREHGGTANITDRDVEQAVAAATAIGDDRLQRQSQGRVVPDSFTHGSSAQRVRWLKIGLDSGDMNRCDTFRAQQL